MSTTCFTSLAQIPTEFRTYAISASARSAGLSSIENSRYQTPSHTYDSSLLQGRSGNGTNHPNTTTSEERPLNSRTSSRREGTSRKRTWKYAVHLRPLGWILRSVLLGHLKHHGNPYQPNTARYGGGHRGHATSASQCGKYRHHQCVGAWPHISWSGIR